MTDARAGSPLRSQILAPPHRANCRRLAKLGLEPQLGGGGHGEQWLEVPQPSIVPGGVSRAGHPPWPGAAKAGTASPVQPSPSLPPQLFHQLPLS